MKQKIFPVKVEQKTFTDKTTKETRAYFVYSVVTSKANVPVVSLSNLGKTLLSDNAGQKMQLVATYTEYKDKDTQQSTWYWSFAIELPGELFIPVKASESLGRSLIVRDCESQK